MGRRRFVAVVASLVLAVSGCRGGAIATRPAFSFSPETVGTVRAVADLGCGASQVTLDSGETRSLTFVSFDDAFPSSCPDQQSPRVRPAFGNWGDPPTGSLLLLGHDGAGNPWYGWADAGEPPAGVIEGHPAAFFVESAAFEDGDAFLLPAGVSLRKSASYRPPSGFSSPILALEASMIWLDRDGSVLTIEIPEAS